jgi:hypothetical protein
MFLSILYVVPIDILGPEFEWFCTLKSMQRIESSYKKKTEHEFGLGRIVNQSIFVGFDPDIATYVDLVTFC